MKAVDCTLPVVVDFEGVGLVEVIVRQIFFVAL